MPTTRSVIKDALTNFSTVFSKTIDDEIISTYFAVLRKYPEGSVIAACQACYDECEFFPKPADIVKRLKKATGFGHDQELRDRWTCKVCNTKSHFFIDGKCLLCHQGVPISEGRQDSVMQTMPGPAPYNLRHNMQCSRCHKGPTMCIKDPPESEFWLCRDCYTGMTGAEIGAKFKSIMDPVKSFDDIPDSELPF